MKKSLWSKILSIGLILTMILAMFPLTSLSILTETIGEPESPSMIPDLEEVIQENSSELAELIAFAQGEIPGYGSNGKFLAPIGAPAANATQIYTAQDLSNMRNNLAGSYILMNDIDLSGYNGNQWVPIGDNSTNANSSWFTGTFDGQGYVIRNLRITGNTYQYNGLFGWVNGTIKNVGFEGTQISTSVGLSSSFYTSYNGTICGYRNGGTISNCYNTGNISSSVSGSTTYNAASYVGGIVGYGSSVTYCYNTGNISATSSASTSRTASSYSGGISGYSGSVSNCYNTGIISSSSTSTNSSSQAYAGGISSSAGSNSRNFNSGHIVASSYCSSSNTSTCNAFAGGIIGNGNCVDSYNSGGVSSYSTFSSYAGGICGTGSSSISSCYNTENASSYSLANAYAGGICGYSSSTSASISNCYNSGGVSSCYSSNAVYAGGICGQSTSTISNCVVLSDQIYADTSQKPDIVLSYLIGYGGLRSGNKVLSGIAGNAVDDSNGRISPEQAKSQATYQALGWDFSSLWTMVPGYEYPQLSWSLAYDVNLAGLDVDTGTVWPAFNSLTTDYTVWVPYSSGNVTISAPTNHPGATTKHGGIIYSDEFAQPLEVGSNTVIIEVEPEIGTKEKTYTVTVNRAIPASEAKLKNLSIGTDDYLLQLDPFFDPDQTSYTASVLYDFDSIIISAETEDQNATIEGTGEKNLEIGANSFYLEVTAEDGITKETYQITITRKPPPFSNDAKLRSLSLSTGVGQIELEPFFDPGETNYIASVPYEVENLTVLATTNHPRAGISGTGLKFLEVGSNTITVEVTAEDGITQEKYAIVVTRDPKPPSPAIIDIIPSRGELTPSFDMNETNYTVSVAGDVSSISITVLTGEEDISIYFSQGSSYQAGKQWTSDPFNLDLPEKTITVYVYKDGLPQPSYNITIMRDPQPTPIYIWEATGDIGTVGRVLFDMPNDPNFLDEYALVCDEDINAEIYFSPIRTENAIAAGQNTYVFAVRLPNGETKKDISFSFKPVGGSIVKNKIIIYGDVNDDGDVSTTDATLVTRWAGGNATTVLKNILAADINGDGNITTTDATLITRRAGGNTSTIFSIESRF